MEADYFGPSQATLCVLCLAHEFELRGSHVHLYNLHGEKSSGLLCVCLFKLSTVGCQMIYFGFLKYTSTGHIIPKNTDILGFRCEH